MINHIADVGRMATGRWRWRKAHTLADLANLQADQIARNLAAQTDDDLGPEWSMYSALVALGRAGAVVADWRPGVAAHSLEHGVEMQTRAAVSAFASTEVKDMLDNLLYRAGYNSVGADALIDFNVIELWAPGCVEYDRYDGDDSARWGGQAVERMDGVPTSWIGGSTDARQIYRAFPTRRSVQWELRAAWLITIADRKWGDSTLFADLLQMLIEARQPATA